MVTFVRQRQLVIGLSAGSCEDKRVEPHFSPNPTAAFSPFGSKRVVTPKVYLKVVHFCLGLCFCVAPWFLGGKMSKSGIIWKVFVNQIHRWPGCLNRSLPKWTQPNWLLGNFVSSDIPPSVRPPNLLLTFWGLDFILVMPQPLWSWSTPLRFTVVSNLWSAALRGNDLRTHLRSSAGEVGTHQPTGGPP